MRLLILGGTTEATALAAAVSNDSRFDTLLSFAGATRAPRPPAVPHRIGGFGGIPGLVAALADVDLLIDATHPFAARMKHNAAQAASLTNTPFLAIRRPEWQPTESDSWTEVPNMAAAAQSLGPTPRRILLTIGQKDLAAFQSAPWHHYTVRSVDPPRPETLPPNATVISARGPFRLADELALLRHHRIEILVTKNSGGTATEPKLEAARTLRLPVVMVQRPPHPEAPTAADIPTALAWLDGHAATDRGA